MLQVNLSRHCFCVASTNLCGNVVAFAATQANLPASFCAKGTSLAEHFHLQSSMLMTAPST